MSESGLLKAHSRRERLKPRQAPAATEQTCYPLLSGVQETVCLWVKCLSVVRGFMATCSRKPSTAGGHICCAFAVCWILKSTRLRTTFNVSTCSRGEVLISSDSRLKVNYHDGRSNDRHSEATASTLIVFLPCNPPQSLGMFVHYMNEQVHKSNNVFIPGV